MSVRVVLPYRAKVIASRIDDFPAPVRPVITVYFSGNRSGGTVFSGDRMYPPPSTFSKTEPPPLGGGLPLETPGGPASASSPPREPPLRPPEAPPLSAS